MPYKNIEAPFNRRECFKKFIDRMPFNEKGKDNFLNFIMVLDEIEESHKNALWGFRTYAFIKGTRVKEGHPTEIG